LAVDVDEDIEKIIVSRKPSNIRLSTVIPHLQMSEEHTPHDISISKTDIIVETIDVVEAPKPNV
jgi:hypothetical protein